MMKSSISLACVAVLCSAIAVACGGAEPEDLGERDVAQNETATDSVDTNSNGDAEGEPSDVASGEGADQEVDYGTCVGWDNGGRHCLANCGSGWEFVGAYPNIQYGGCQDAAWFYCGNRPYYGACWGWGQ